MLLRVPQGYTELVTFCLPSRRPRVGGAAGGWGADPRRNSANRRRSSTFRSNSLSISDIALPADGNSSDLSPSAITAAASTVPHRRSSTAQRQTLFGREAERTVLRRAVHSLARSPDESGGCVLVIDGGPGIGKSHLVADLQGYCADYSSGEISEAACLAAENTDANDENDSVSSDSVEDEDTAVAAAAAAAAEPEPTTKVHVLATEGTPHESDVFAVIRPILLGALRIYHGLLSEEHVPRSCLASMVPDDAPWSNSAVRALLDDGEPENEVVDNERVVLAVEVAVALLRTVFAVHKCVVTIDDLHHVGPATWDILECLTSEAQPSAMFAFVTRPLAVWSSHHSEDGPRDSSSPVKSGMSRWKGMVELPWTLTMSLGPIDEAATAAMVGDWFHCDPSKILAPAARIHERCGGNPLFIKLVLSNNSTEGALASRDDEEIFEDESLSFEKLPTSISEIVLTQLDRLTIAEQIVVKTACALGRRFERSVLQALYGGSAVDLDLALASLAAHHYFDHVENMANDVRFAFNSSAVSEVIYSLMLTEQRERFHVQIGEFYERACARRLSAGVAVGGTGLLQQLAYHFSRSGDPDKAVRYLVSAGHDAVARGQYKEAETQYRDALSRLPSELGASLIPKEAQKRSGVRRHSSVTKIARSQSGSADGSPDNGTSDANMAAHLMVSIAEIYCRFDIAPPDGVSPIELLLRARAVLVTHCDLPQTRTLAHAVQSLAWAEARYTLDSDARAAEIERRFEEALQLREDRGSLSDVGDSMNGIGCFIHMRGGKLSLTERNSTGETRGELFARARVALERSVELRRQGDGWSPELAQSWCSLGMLLIDVDDDARTVRLGQEEHLSVDALERSEWRTLKAELARDFGTPNASGTARMLAARVAYARAAMIAKSSAASSDLVVLCAKTLSTPVLEELGWEALRDELEKHGVRNVEGTARMLAARLVRAVQPKGENSVETEQAIDDLESLGWIALHEELTERGLHARGTTRELAVRLASANHSATYADVLDHASVVSVGSSSSSDDEEEDGEAGDCVADIDRSGGTNGQNTNQAPYEAAIRALDQAALLYATTLGALCSTQVSVVVLLLLLTLNILLARMYIAATQAHFIHGLHMRSMGLRARMRAWGG